MKTLIALLLVTLGLGAAYWKLQHPDATLDDVKLGANHTLERAKTGFAAFRSGSPADASTTAEANAEAQAQQAEQQAAINDRILGLEGKFEDRLAAIEAGTLDLDGTVINGRLTDAERRMDANDQKFTQINDSIDALAEEIDTVSSSLGNLNDNVAASATQEDDFKSQLGTLSRQVSDLKNQVSEQDAEQTLTNIGTRIDSIDSRLTELSGSKSLGLDELNAKMTLIADQTSALEGRINTLSVDSNGDGSTSENLSIQVDQRLQQMENKLATANADALRVNSLVERLNAANDQISSLNAAQTDTASNNERVDALLKALDSNTKKTAVLESQLNEANEKLASLSDELAELKNTGSKVSVESLQAELNEQLELLKTRIENTNDNTDIATLNQTLATTRDRIQLLESRVQELPSDGDNAEAAQVAQSELQQQILAMEERLRALPQQTDPKLLSTLNQVQAEVAELRDRDNSDGIEYKVYFGNGSIAISDDAAVVLKSFIKQEQNRTTGVNIYGFTDRRGDAAYNQRLALQRATAVRSFLIQNGFDFTKIKSLSGLGEDAAAATLDDGAADADQRTVVLVADQP